jgi:hypothetical protein
MYAEARKILKRQFEELAEYARRGGRPKRASCFDALAATVDQVSSQLFGAYLESFENIEDGKVDFALRLVDPARIVVARPTTEFMERLYKAAPAEAAAAISRPRTAIDLFSHGARASDAAGEGRGSACQAEPKWNVPGASERQDAPVGGGRNLDDCCSFSARTRSA